MTTADQKFVEVYRAGSLAQAYAIRIALEDAGIPVVLGNTNLDQAIGDVPTGWSIAPRLLVDESQVYQAQEIIRQTDPQTGSDSGLTLSELIGLVPRVPFATVFSVTDHFVPTAKPTVTEPTCCLSCGHEMTDAESSCSACGWTYETAANDEPATDDFE